MSAPNAADLQCFSDSEAAKLLGVCRRTIVSLRQSGELKFLRIGRRVAIRQSHLAEFMERNQVNVGGIHYAA